MTFDLDVSNPYYARAVTLREAFAQDAVANDHAGGRPEKQLGLLKQSGLLKLLIPTELGGEGQPWSTALRIGREFAKEDGSLGHLYGYHFSALLGVGLRGAPERARHLWRESAQNNWFWGNTANSFSKSLFGRRDPDGNGYILDGFRPFTSGSHIADMLSIAWENDAGTERRFAAIPSNKPGVVIEHDWDGIGQRQTGSGRVTYNQVHVREDETIGGPVPFTSTASNAIPVRTLGPLLQQSVLLNVFVGSAQGALLAARRYTLEHSRPWLHSGVERHEDDPWIQRQYGELWTQTQAATLLADRAARALDQAWSRGDALTAHERGEAALAVAAANVLAGQVSLRVSREMFEVMGARSAVRSLGLDRYWRNVRIHTLHNPAEYKTRNVGRWLLGLGHPSPGTFQ